MLQLYPFGAPARNDVARVHQDQRTQPPATGASRAPKNRTKGTPTPIQPKHSCMAHARIAHRRRSQSTAVWLTPESRIADVWQIAKNRALLLSLTCVGRYAERRYQSCWCARTWEWVPPCSMAPEYALFAPPLSRTALPSHPVSHVVACTPSVLHWMCLLPVAVPVRSSP